VGAVTVGVADDHPAFRDGLAAVLGEGFRVCFTTADAATTIAAVVASPPQVLLCDLQMPGGGLAVVAACRELTRVVILSVTEVGPSVVGAIAAGAIGYLPKTTPTETLRTEVRRAAAGYPVMSPALAVLLGAEYRRLARSHGVNPLTDREAQVVSLVATGATYAQIATELYVSLNTVQRHIQRIFAKVGVRRRAELARWADRHLT
jgi:DNA-binding NarL/FixJ family response regulator